MTSCPTNKSCSSACRMWALFLEVVQPELCNALWLDIHPILTCLLAFYLQTRNHYESTRDGMEELMKRMKNPSQICKMQSSIPMEGYLYCQEKCACAGDLDRFLKRNTSSDRLFPWQQGLWECRGSNITADITRRGGSCSWCHVSRRPQLSRWRNLPLLQRLEMSISCVTVFLPQGPTQLTLKSCIRRKSDSIDKRFCFDVETSERLVQTKTWDGAAAAESCSMKRWTGGQQGGCVRAKWTLAQRVLEHQARSGSRWRYWAPRLKSCSCFWLLSFKIGLCGDRLVLKVWKMPGLCICCSKSCELVPAWCLSNNNCERLEYESLSGT